jgi:phosphate transport system protein
LSADARKNAMPLHLHRDLDQLQKDLFLLALDVEQYVQTAARCLRDHDLEAAGKVIADHLCVSEKQVRLKEECLKVLALHQPVAIDLRRVITVLKINTDLERMTGLAQGIAGRSVALAELPPVAVPAKIPLMTNSVLQMVRQSLNAFFHLDAQQARNVCLLDDEVDQFGRQIIRELLPMMKVADAMEGALSLFSATRNLERIADYAVGIAEDVVFLVEGTLIRHRHRDFVAAIS